MTEFFERHLNGTSQKISLNNGINATYDLFIFTVGWEDRCKRIINYDSNDFKIIKAIILNYNNQKGHEQTIIDFLDKKNVPFSSYILESPKNPIFETYHEQKSFDEFKICDDNKIKNIDYIISLIKEKYKELKKPLTIGFDISSCSRLYFLKILHYCITENITSEISFFYSEGKYELKDNKFTEGLWNIAIIPGYQPTTIDMKKKKHYIISFGFDWQHYIGFLNNYEADSISLLLPQPGYNQEYTERNEKEFGKFKEKLKINDNSLDEDTSKTEAGDAIAAWESLDSLIKSKGKEYTITCLPYGPKPHALAMGLKSILNPELILLYRIPSEKYNQINVTPTGNFWKYTIRNLLYF